MDFSIAQVLDLFDIVAGSSFLFNKTLSDYVNASVSLNTHDVIRKLRFLPFGSWKLF